MNQTLINDEIRITLPAEFHLMDPEEKKSIYALSAVVPDWSARDAERHMIFSASWKRMNGILAAMACSMDGKKAFGFTFRCEGKEGELLNRTVMVRSGGCIYYLTSQFRADLETESKAVTDEIWRSLSWD